MVTTIRVRQIMHRDIMQLHLKSIGCEFALTHSEGERVYNYVYASEKKNFFSFAFHAFANYCSATFSLRGILGSRLVLLFATFSQALGKFDCCFVMYLFTLSRGCFDLKLRFVFEVLRPPNRSGEI